MNPGEGFNKDDLVDLVIMTKHAAPTAVRMTREFATSQIRGWFITREDRLKMSWWKILYSYIVFFPNWLRPYTYALNSVTADGSLCCAWAVDSRYIIGFYIREIEKNEYTEYSRKIAEAQSKIAETISREASKGEEWKEEHGEDEE